MKGLTLDLYQQRDSPVHRLDPRVKVVLTILVIVSNVLVPEGDWLAMLATWTFLLLVTQLARIPLGFVLSRSAIVLPFTLAAVTTAFSTPGRELFTLPWPEVTLTEPGLIRLGTIILRSWLSVQAAILLSATTEYPDLIHALRHLKLPGVLVSIISFMYRYLFVLISEARRLLRARASRSAHSSQHQGGLGLRDNIRVGGSMIGQLFLRSIARAERVYRSMQSRGYRGHLLTLNPHIMKTTDWTALGGTAVFFIFIQLLIH